MIITLKGANFSESNIGTLSTYSIRFSGNVTNSNTSVDRETNTGYTATVTLNEGYELSGVITVTMGDTDITSTAVNGLTITIPTKVTGNVVITVPTKSTASGGEVVDPEPENPGSGEVVEPEIVTGTLPLVQQALSVVSGENFYQVGTENKARMSTSSTTEATGIWIDAGATITLTGTSGLRFDYVYATKPGPNSNDKTVNTIGGVGTASNFVSSNFFPLNADGSSNTISFTNNNSTGYYYFFAIAAPNKSDQILVANYQGKITYTITPAEAEEEDTPTDYPTSGTFTLSNKMLSVVSGENFMITTTNTKRMTTASNTEATGIYIPQGKTITITGTSGLRMDYVWADNAGPASTSKSTAWGGIGAASNFDSANYFPLNIDGSSNTISVTNDKGNYYFFFCFAAPDKTTEIPVANYNITWAIS